MRYHCAGVSVVPVAGLKASIVWKAKFFGDDQAPRHRRALSDPRFGNQRAKPARRKDTTHADCEDEMDATKGSDNDHARRAHSTLRRRVQFAAPVDVLSAIGAGAAAYAADDNTTKSTKVTSNESPSATTTTPSSILVVNPPPPSSTPSSMVVVNPPPPDAAEDR